MDVDRHMIGDTGGERIAEYFAFLNEGDMSRPSMSTAFSLDQVLACTESATSEYSTTSHCLSALLGRSGRVKFILNDLGWKKK